MSENEPRKSENPEPRTSENPERPNSDVRGSTPNVRNPQPPTPNVQTPNVQTPNVRQSVFSMVLTALDHHHWMFFEGPTIGFNGFSMVFEIPRAMVNDGLDVPLHKNVRKINMRQNELMNICWTPNPSIYSIETSHTVQHRKWFPILISLRMPINLHKYLTLHCALHIHNLSSLTLPQKSIVKIENCNCDDRKVPFTANFNDLRRPLTSSMIFRRPLEIFNGFWEDHHHWMFFGGLTIAINGFSMVFDLATIAFNGFRWLWTIGQTMRWFRWIVVVYLWNLLGVEVFEQDLLLLKV